MRAWIAAAIVAACVATAVRARAQAPPPAPAPAPPALVPPKAIETGRVPYPDGAAGDASVVLELLVDKDGRVARVVVVDGREPFASAASARAASFRFEPAKRGDVTVAARIRILVEFHEPLVARPRRTRRSPPAAGVAKPAPADSVEEVRVAGRRPDVGGTQLGGGEVRQIPGAFGDPFRAIDALPGVTPIVSGLPFFFVRGAPPGNIGYFIDGVRVPLLFHFGVLRRGGAPGAHRSRRLLPRRVPRALRPLRRRIIDGQTVAPSHHFTAREREPPRRRRAHRDAVRRRPGQRHGRRPLRLPRSPPHAPRAAGFLQYGDYQTRASWKLTDHDTIGVFAFGSYDAAGTRENGSLKDVTSTQFHRVDLRWDHDLGTEGRMRTALTLGLDQTRTSDEFAVRDSMWGLRNEIDYRVSSSVRVRAGADLLAEHYTLASNTADQENFPGRNDIAMGLRADVVLRVSPAVDDPGRAGRLFRVEDGARRRDGGGADVRSAPRDPG